MIFPYKAEREKTPDEVQLAWFLQNLMNDYETLDELYALRDKPESNDSEAYRHAILMEIETYKKNVKRHQAELNVFLMEREAAEPVYTLDEIADACMSAEVSDSRFEAIGIYLQAKRKS